VYSSGTLSGWFDDNDSSANFGNQHYTKTSGPSLCMADVYTSAKYRVTDGESPVFVN
jgi:hypothetical protein